MKKFKSKVPEIISIISLIAQELTVLGAEIIFVNKSSQSPSRYILFSYAGDTYKLRISNHKNKNIQDDGYIVFNLNEDIKYSWFTVIEFLCNKYNLVYPKYLNYRKLCYKLLNKDLIKYEKILKEVANLFFKDYLHIYKYIQRYGNSKTILNELKYKFKQLILLFPDLNLLVEQGKLPLTKSKYSMEEILQIVEELNGQS